VGDGFEEVELTVQSMLKALGEKVTLTNRSPQGKISQEPSSGEAPERSLHASSPGNIHQAPSGDVALSAYRAEELELGVDAWAVVRSRRHALSLGGELLFNPRASLLLLSFSRFVLWSHGGIETAKADANGSCTKGEGSFRVSCKVVAYSR
jgi:hypothetical protein